MSLLPKRLSFPNDIPTELGTPARLAPKAEAPAPEPAPLRHDWSCATDKDVSILKRTNTLLQAAPPGSEQRLAKGLWDGKAPSVMDWWKHSELFGLRCAVEVTTRDGQPPLVTKFKGSKELYSEGAKPQATVPDSE